MDLNQKQRVGKNKSVDGKTDHKLKSTAKDSLFRDMFSE